MHILLTSLILPESKSPPDFMLVSVSPPPVSAPSGGDHHVRPSKGRHRVLVAAAGAAVAVGGMEPQTGGHRSVRITLSRTDPEAV